MTVMSMLGALIGDSAGSLLESAGLPTIDDVDVAMTMPGGGTHAVLPGQCTDDGEMTIALAHALLEAPNTPVGDAPFDGFPCALAAKWFGRWIATAPFDVGNTCAASLREARSVADADVTNHVIAYRCMQMARKRSSTSKANGSLMRCTPVAICYHRMSDQRLLSYAMAQAQLSHPNLTCCICDALYSIAIAHLIRSPKDRVGACQRVERFWAAWKTSALAELSYAQDNSNDKCSTEQVETFAGNRQCILEVDDWLVAARTGKGLEAAYPFAGFVRHAFTYAFYHLYRGTDFDSALRQVLSLGGDTDTNACIVGGLIGAAVGVEGIPDHMRQKVSRCQSDHHFALRARWKMSTIRPAWLWPNQIEHLATQLYNKNPT